MTLASEVEVIGGLLKKYYQSGPARKQFWDDNLLTKRLFKNRRDIQGGTAVVGLHTTTNVGVGAAANGAPYGNPGKQGFSQAIVPLRYTYGPTRFTGPDIANSRDNAGAFANVMTANMTGTLEDMKADINRQLFADGSGGLAFSTADQDGSFIITAEPFLWAPITNYIKTGMTLDQIDLADGTTQLSADTLAGSIIVASVSSTAVTGTSAEVGTGKDGDLLGKWGALMRIVSSTVVMNEMMGLYGAISNTNGIGDAAFQYDAGEAGNTAVTNWTGPEGQAHDWTIAGVSNDFQGIDVSSSNSWWKSVVYGNGGVPRAITFKLIDDMLAKLTIERGAKISAIYTTWQIRNKLMDLIRADRRYSEKMTLDGGMSVDSYNGVAILVSKDCPRGVMMFVDEAEFAMYVKEDFTFIEDGRGNNLFKISGYDGYECVGKVYANLGCMNRSKHGKIIDILES